MGKYLNFYYTNLKRGHLLHDGLCNCDNINKNKLMLFEPTCNDYTELDIENKSSAYWGAGVNYESPHKAYGFTDLRQTIVLFMAAMNNEL